MRLTSKLMLASVFSFFSMVTSLSAAPAYVTGNGNACSSSSCAVSLTGTNAGDLIVVGLFVLDSTSVTSVTDTQGNTYTLIGSPQTWSPYQFVERLYYAKNIKGGANTTTVTLSGSQYMEVHLYDYSGLDPSSPLDVSASPQTGTSVTGTSGTLTTSNANDLLFGFFHSDNSVTNTAGSGFTGRTLAADGTPLAEDKYVTSTGSYSATMNFSGSADYVGFLVAFKAASGAPVSYVTGNASACSTSSCAVSLTGTNASDLIVVGLFVLDSTSVTSVTDTQGNTYTLIGSPQTWSPYQFVERLYYAKNIKGGANTTTVTLSGSQYMEVHLYDYSGLDPSSPLDASATPQTGTSVTGTSGTLSTSNANDLLFGFFHSDNSVTNTAGSGFTGRTLATDGTPLAEDEHVTSTGSYSATMNFSGSADYVGFLVAFKAAAGGGGSLSISGVSVSPTATTAVVSWTTNASANSRVDYGTSSAYGSNVSDSTLVTSHSLTLNSLTCNTTYHYQISSVGSAGSASTADATFTTGGCGGSAPAYVTGNVKACTATSCGVSLTSTNAGDLIVLGLFVLNSTTVSSVIDAQGNQYTLIGSPQTWAPYNFVERLYYAKNIKGGADTATVTLSGSTYMEVRLYEYSGLDTSSPLDASATPHTGSSVTTGTSGVLTTTNANDLLFGFFHSDNSVTNTAGSGFTGRTLAADGIPLAEDQYVTSTNSYSATMGFSASADYVGFLVAFKAAATGGGGSLSISGVSVSPTATTAVVSWTTNASANSRVDYGTSSAYGSNVSNSTLVTSHSLTLNSLTCNTTYHYQISSVGSAGSASTADATFTTGACPIAISGVSVATAANSATVAWTTNVSANGRVDYGTSSAYGSNVSDSTLVTSHSLTLTSLTCNTTYHYQITSVGSAGSASTADATFTTSACGGPVWDGVLTQHNDNARTGQNTFETILNTTNVNVNQFGKLFAMPVDGQVYAQPLYVPGVTINGVVHNVVIIATEADSVYAYDADSKSAVLLWKASMVDANHGAGSGETPLNSATTIGCADLQPLIGITATPVIDPTSKTIYVEAKSTDGLNYFHRLHALDILTGNEKSPGPIKIAATVAGTGDGSTNGQLVFDSNAMSLHQMARPGLLLMNSTIYIAYASHCDSGAYHGWLFAYDETTFTQTSVYVTTPNGGLGGFWMSGAGIAADASGNIFIASGNGDFNMTSVPVETGDTILKLGTASQILTQLDYFTPYDQLSLDTSDSDLGSGGVLLLPDQSGSFPHILVEAGKEGRVYVVNRDQMTKSNSHYCSGCTNDPEIIEESGTNTVGSGIGMFNLAAYWNSTLYFWGVHDVLKSIPISNGLPDFTHITGSTPQIGFPGAGVSISSNGTTTGSAIVWAIDSSQAKVPGPAVLYGYDATNIQTMLYSSAQNATRDTAGNAVKFAVPTVANGKVYVGTSTEVDVYGLNP